MQSYLQRVFNPYIIMGSLCLVLLFVLGYLVNAPSVDFDSSLNILFQVAAVLFGINIIGLTVNQGRESNWEKSSTAIKEIEKWAGELFSMYGHPRLAKLKRTDFVNWVFDFVRCRDLVFRDAVAGDHFYVYRPYWDGVWYQTQVSPVTENLESERARSISVLHQAVLCADALLRCIDRTRQSGCCKLSTKQGTQGTRHFLEILEKEKLDRGLLSEDEISDAMTIGIAKSLIRLAIHSTHYLDEELREQASDPNWASEEVSEFGCHFVECISWLNNLTFNLQFLRIVNVSARTRDELEFLVDATSEKLRLNKLHDVRTAVNELRPNSLAEYGASFRLAEIKRAAIPGIGWTIVFLVLVLAVPPLIKVWGDKDSYYWAYAGIYFFGLTACLESINFAMRLVWPPRTERPMQRFGSNPRG